MEVLNMSKRTYDDEFKLHVVNEYFKSKNGIRLTARAFGLPSKNYITRWIEDLKARGLIPADMAKTGSTANKLPSVLSTKKTPLEKQLEAENLRLRAENDFLKKLKQVERRNAGR